LQISGALVNGPVLGSTSGTAVAAGYVGQRIDGVWASPANNPNTVLNIFTIALPAGVWMLYGKVYCASAGVTGYLELLCSISTTSATLDSETLLGTVNSTVSRDVVFGSLPKYVATSGQTYYFTARAAIGGGSLSAGWIQNSSSFYAVRIA
jgi:hypothetical protein